MRREMLRRVAKALALGYASQIQGITPAERMRRWPTSWHSAASPCRSTGAGRTGVDGPYCPYPNLAEHDRDICTMEKMLFSELLGSEIELTRCRLDGASECRFQTR